MLNVAICIGGSLRSIEYCIDNFNKNIILPNEDNMNLILFYYIPNDSNSKKSSFLNKKNTFLKIKDDKKLKFPNILWGGRTPI